MTQIEKTDMDLDVISLIKKLTEDKDPRNAAMYVRGDAEFNVASICLEGDVKLLSATLIHHLANNVGFKQFLTAVLGGFLSQNPEEKKMFLAGLQLMEGPYPMKIVK